MIPDDPRVVRAAKVRPLVAYALVAALCAVIVVSSMTARAVLHAVQRPPQAAAPATIEFGSRLVGRAGDSVAHTPASATPTGPLTALVAGHAVPVSPVRSVRPGAHSRVHRSVRERAHHHAVRPEPSHHVLTATPAAQPIRHAQPPAATVHRGNPNATIKQVNKNLQRTNAQTHHLVRNVVAKTDKTVKKVLAGTNKLIKTVRLPHLSLHLLGKPATSA